MARFICALHAPDATPRAFALVEQLPGDGGPVYAVRDLRQLSGDDPAGTVFDAVASEPQYAGQTTFVTTGGQRAADALHEHGPSAVAVTITGEASGDADAMDVSAQVLVDTFQRLYRDSAVETTGSLDAATGAVDALHAAADLDAAAPDSDRDDSGDLDTETGTLGSASYEGEGPKRTVIEQTGSAEPVSTEAIDAPVGPDEASVMATEGRERVGRIASPSGGPAPDLGEHEATALALALACWYGEASRDDLPATDMADEAITNRVNRPARRN